MTGKYLMQSARGAILFQISMEGETPKASVEAVETGMKMKVVSTSLENQTLTIVMEFFMAPEVPFIINLEWKESFYEAKGTLPFIGEVAGAAEPFTGKTKYEVMIEELPAYRTGKVVRRTEEDIQQAVGDLLAQMTLEEKIGQMSQSGGMNTAAIGGAVKKIMTEEEMITSGYMGSMIMMAPMEVAFEKQKLAVEKSRLAIPLMFCQDVIHGSQTIFPIPLGWSCSFSPQLVQKAMEVAAFEASAQGIAMGFSPMLDIARDPRWGRVSEGNGEDPYLCARMCEAHVKGFQGEDLYAPETVMACLKHYVGYSAAEAGRDYNTTEISNTSLFNTYLPPFMAGVEAGAASIMNSFNVMDSVPVVINKRVCRDILRDEMKFEGMLISDYNAVTEVIVHGAAEGSKDVSVKAVKASLDIEMASANFLESLADAVGEGLVEEALIDQSVRRILTYKYKSGLMDDPYKYFQPEKEDKIYQQSHLQVSYDLAKESIVLLKNDGILPLSGQKVALIGPKADSTDLLGPWQFSSYSDQTVTLKQGLEARGVQVVYEMGSGIDKPAEGGIERAVEAAKMAQVIVLALGETMNMSGEAASRQSITIPQPQMDLALALQALGKPIILVLTNGRPLILDWFDANAAAIVETWFMGSQAGYAIADVLLGNYNPSGKLSITFPRNQGQIPVYYNHLRTGRPYTEGSPDKFVSRYLDGTNLPLYTFGYGLSYTTFEVADLALSSTVMHPDGTLTVSVTVKNTGTCPGMETVQLYIHDVAAQIARPVKELKGFEKVNLQPGQQVRVDFKIDTEALSYYNQESRKVWDPGKFEVFVGTSSRDEDLMKAEFVLEK